MSLPNDMERMANRAVLKYAVQRRMFNNDGTVADVRRSVLVEVFIPNGVGGRDTHAMTLFSGAEFDSLPDLRETSALLPEGSVIELWDGRFLFGSGKAQSGYLKLVSGAAPAASAQTESLF